jgi:hypothetical protein
MLKQCYIAVPLRGVYACVALVRRKWMAAALRRLRRGGAARACCDIARLRGWTVRARPCWAIPHTR